MNDHDALLRAIIAAPDDNLPRLVFADWLEERGETARADFIRVQCELASPALSEERRHALRVRERDLLNEHRQEWLQEIGLPLEDVCFQRGLIASARLAQWDGGKVLAAEFASRLATVAELDLSGLGIGDAGLIGFAATPNFPALRKLILSENKISDAGVTALANSVWFPRLETVYLFGNSIGEGARRSLEAAAHFRLTNLDIGEHADGYSMSPGEAELARRQYIRKHLLPAVTQHFKTYELLQSAMLCVAQYWSDEADDAVHKYLVVSELWEPTLEGVKYSDDEEPPVDPNLPHTPLRSEYGEPPSVISVGPYDDNYGAIPLWAAFAPEGGNQDYETMAEVYAPAVMFYRHGGYDILPMLRPHLDGIRPEWDRGE